MTGINYTYNAGGTFNSFTADMQLLQKCGFDSVRLIIPSYTDLQIPTYRTYVQQALSMGFHVVWGVSANYSGTTKIVNRSNFAAYSTGSQNEATWCASQNNSNLELIVGNELERQRWAPITSITQTGGVATVTSSYPHQYTNGETVYVRGAKPSGYNGSFTITYVDTTHFTYPCSSSLTSPATEQYAPSTIQTSDYSDADFLIAISGVVTADRAIYPYDITYSVPTGSPDQNNVGNNLPSLWKTQGIGSLTRLGFNIYGFYDQVGVNPQSGISNLNYIINNFAAGTYQFPEWDIDSGNSWATAGSDEFKYANAINKILTLMKANNVPEYFFTFKDPIDNYGVVTNAGNYRLALATVAGKRPWYTPGSTTLTRGATPSRSVTSTRGANPTRTVIR